MKCKRTFFEEAKWRHGRSNGSNGRFFLGARHSVLNKICKCACLTLKPPSPLSSNERESYKILWKRVRQSKRDWERRERRERLWKTFLHTICGGRGWCRTGFRGLFSYPFQNWAPRAGTNWNCRFFPKCCRFLRGSYTCKKFGLRSPLFRTDVCKVDGVAFFERWKGFFERRLWLVGCKIE